MREAFTALFVFLVLLLLLQCRHVLLQYQVTRRDTARVDAMG